MPTPDDAYRRLFPLLRRKCEQLLGATGEAEEVAQEALVKMWKEERARGPLPRQVAGAYTVATLDARGTEEVLEIELTGSAPAATHFLQIPKEAP